MSAPINVLPVEPNGEGGQPASVLAALDGIAEVDSACELETFGHDDLAAPAASLLHRLVHGTTAYERRLLVAVAGRATLEGLKASEVLGYAWIALPLLDNRHLAELTLRVRPDARRRGAGSALAVAVIELARANGRTHVSTWADSAEAAPDEPDAVAARVGAVRARLNDSLRFGLARGCEVAQVERYSLLRVPACPESPAPAPGYRLESWLGPVGPHHLDGLAQLYGSFDDDAPTGDLAVEAQRWTPERLAEQHAASDPIVDRLTVVAIAEETGEYAGATELHRQRDKLVCADQGLTVVRRSHRGHGLGLALKREALAVAREAWPGLARVHTWNAGENDRMWAINEALGFVTGGATVLLQWREPGSR